MTDIVLIDLDNESAEWDDSKLSREETDRADSIVGAKSRQRWIRSRLACRKILAARLSCDPKSIRFDTSSGKPRVASETDGRAAPPACRFSISRSAGVACIAVSSKGEVGVDIERLRPVRHRRQKISRFFCECEREELSRSMLEVNKSELTKRNLDEAFLQVWTAKEAVLKACGIGLTSFPVTSVCIQLAPRVAIRHAARSIQSFANGTIQSQTIQVTNCAAPEDATKYVIAIAQASDENPPNQKFSQPGQSDEIHRTV